MKPILLFIFLTSTLLLTLNGCITSNLKEVGTKAQQTVHWHTDQDHQLLFMMQQPERHLLHSISDLNTLDPRQIKGLSAKDVINMFGVPDFKRYDLLAEIWQYREKNCLLDIFLYVDRKQKSILRVKYAEIRGRTVYKISQKNCFHDALRVKS